MGGQRGCSRAHLKRHRLELEGERAAPQPLHRHVFSQVLHQLAALGFQLGARAHRSKGALAADSLAPGFAVARGGGVARAAEAERR